MKYAIVLPDGAADEQLPQLGGRTPLEAADIPHMDSVSMGGQLGRVVTVPEAFIPGTDVATLSILGYDPHVYYSGRAPIEAAVKGITAGPDELIFRCNFVTIEHGRMKDFTADHISQAEAERLIADLHRLFKDEPCTFHSGVSYRNLMLASDAAELEVTCTPPHDIPNQPVADWLPQGSGSDRIQRLMERAAEMLDDHEVNRIRAEQRRDPVTDIWLWGQGRPVEMEPFASRFGVSAAVITGVDIIRGLAISTGMQLIEVHGATGYIDTNYKGKGDAAVRALDTHDMVIVHVEAPDEAGHLGDADAKIEALERIDELIVGPLLGKLRETSRWRMLIAPDHPTPVSTKAHSAVPPPFCFAGKRVDADAGLGFTEGNAHRAGLVVDPGYGLMGLFTQK
ncbi:MAG: cofactor-independent phosphoglycerate mutase [Phycisphaerae bacterium]|jgi:2,3-bisphosphoglycerate-independent phosphoglycerate mutase